ncbi:hypothetical protein TNCV_4308231 [Trichonephila clavipes]|nr:hypothetical protein TNCV_4308231 [Trichonephila clavipes]
MVENRRITRVPGGRDTRILPKRVNPLGKEKITRAPREHETRTHLKKVSPLRITSATLAIGRSTPQARKEKKAHYEPSESDEQRSIKAGKSSTYTLFTETRFV